MFYALEDVTTKKRRQRLQEGRRWAQSLGGSAKADSRRANGNKGQTDKWRAAIKSNLATLVNHR